MTEAAASLDQVDAALVRCRIGIDAAELHGLMTGYLATGGRLEPHDWPDKLHVEADRQLVRQDAVLATLAARIEQSLADPQFGFELLLPGDDAPVAERLAALLDWCRGFLSGYALSSARVALSDAAQEAFADLAEIADFRMEDDEQDEESLVEIIEFVRVAVLLIHADRALGGEDSECLH